MTSVVFASMYHLEIVSVKMERMFSSIVVVEDDLDNVVFLKHEDVCISSVNRHIGGIGSSGHDRVQGRHLWRNIRDVVEESTDDISNARRLWAEK